MTKLFYSVLLLFLLSMLSCQENTTKINEDTFELTLLNDTVFFQGKDPDDIRRFSYNTKEEKDKSYNKIRYRLSNRTNKKYMFFIRDVELAKIYGLNLDILKDGKKIRGGSVLLTRSIPTDSCFVQKTEFLLENEMEKRALLQKLFNMGAKEYYLHYLTQTVVIGPGESREFSAMLSLPFVFEDDIYKLYNNPYYFSLDPKLNY